MATILAVGTATPLCSVAIGRDGECIAVREDKSEKLNHAEKINLFTAEALAEAGLGLKDVDAFAVGIGPGSYTGLRIGVSAVKGWSYALEKPIIGISTLRILVQAIVDRSIEKNTVLWPMIDARRMEVFTQPFRSDGEILGPSAPLILDRDWIDRQQAPIIVFGDGADKAAELWSNAPEVTHLSGILPSARSMIALAEKRYRAQEFDDLAYLVPEYGKVANVKKPQQRG